MPESTVLSLPLRTDPPRARAVVSHGLLGIRKLRFHGDGRLERVVVAWRLVGPPGAPVVAALGGISAGRVTCDLEAPARGWWRELVGPGLPLDTNRFAVLGIDWLGGAGASSAPMPGQRDFPAIDARDQAAALLAVCDRLGIARLHAVAGASYGGMVGLALAETAPERAGAVLAISAAHRSNALATGWRSIQRAIVRYGLERGDGTGALAIARALAMTTYRARNSSAASPTARRRKASQSNATCSPAARTTRGRPRRSLSYACPIPSTGIAWTPRVSVCRCTWSRSPRTSS
jgi:homoserine acetyltransferase